MEKASQFQVFTEVNPLWIVCVCVSKMYMGWDPRIRCQDKGAKSYYMLGRLVYELNGRTLQEHFLLASDSIQIFSSKKILLSSQFHSSILSSTIFF